MVRSAIGDSLSSSTSPELSRNTKLSAASCEAIAASTDHLSAHLERQAISNMEDTTTPDWPLSDPAIPNPSDHRNPTRQIQSNPADQSQQIVERSSQLGQTSQPRGTPRPGQASETGSEYLSEEISLSE